MDFLLGNFARSQLRSLDSQGLENFGSLLELPDPLLETLILGKAELDMSDNQQSGLGKILQQVQDFHDL